MYQVQKKRKSGWFFVVLFLCAFAVGLGIGYAGVRAKLREKNAELPQEIQLSEKNEPMADQEPGQPASAPMAEKQEAEVKNEAEESYFVQEKAGKVCVFRIDSEGVRRFSHYLSIELEALREADKQLFREGIKVSNKEELLSLTEDFGS